MKKLFLLFCLGVLNFSYAQTVLRFANDLTTGFTQYTFPSTDVTYRDASGTAFANGNTSNVCSGAIRRTQLISVILELKSSSISSLKVHGQSSGSTLRTLSSIETSTTLNGTYTPLSGLTTSSTITGTCGTIDVDNISIGVNTFIKLNFSGNVNLSGFDLTPAGGTLEPTIQTSNISFSNVFSTSFTVNYTNGDGTNRAVFVKEGTQGSITNPVDGEAYTASSNWNNGSPSGTQLGTSGYYCVYNGNGNSVNLTNLNPNTTYWVQVFEYNGVGAGTNYLTTTATGNPNNQATNAAATQYYFRTTTNGNWGDLSTWEQSTDNSTWTSATASPNFDNSQSILILDNHEVTLVSGNETIDQTTIQELGKIIIASGATLTVNNGAGDDVIVNGTLELNGTLASNASASIGINGVFENKVNSASFNAGSGTMTIAAGGTYRINGYTGTSSYAFTNVNLTQGIGVLGSNYEVLTGAPRLNSSQTYGNVIWNSPTQGGSFLNNPTVNVSGNFHLINTPSINHGAGGSGRTLNIAGDLIIDGGTYEISADGATTSNTLNVTRNIVVNGGMFNLSSATNATGIGTLNAAGNITLNAGFFGLPENITSGNFTLNGASAQTIAVNQTAVAKVRNIQVSNSNGITLSGSGTLDVREVVSFGNINNATLNAGGVLRLLSTNNLTARIADITNNEVNLGNTITGNVTVERFIPSGKRAFRLLSPAVTTTNFISNNWQQQTHITGGASGGFDVTETNNPSMFTYNNQVASGTGWTAIDNTNATNLTAGVGYRILVRGDRTATNITAATTDNMNTAITLSATGTLRTGTVTFDATSTPAINNTANTTTADYSLLGNPYQSAVDWHLVTRTGIEDTYYAWAPNMGTGAARGNYVAYNVSTGNSGGGQVGQFIQPGQAFFVKNTVSGTAGTLTFQEAHKATTNANVFRTANPTTLTVSLYDPNELAIGGYPIDATKAVFSTEYTNELGLGDAAKLEAAGENIAWFRNNTKLAIEAAAPVTSSDELVMKTIRLGANKNYTFKINTTNFDTDLTPYLVDNFLNTQSQISTSEVYLANFSTTSNVASYGVDRFKIVFQNRILDTDYFVKNIKLYPNPAKAGTSFYLDGIKEATVSVYNVVGQNIPVTVISQGNAVQVAPTAALSQGVYLVTVTTAGKTAQVKWILE